MKEPVVSDGSDGISDPLVADLCVRGVWQPQTVELFDIRVVNADTRSYCGLSRCKWSPAAGGPEGPSKVAADGPPMPQVVPLYHKL